MSGPALFVFLLLAIVSGACREHESPHNKTASAQNHWNVLLVTLDTTRADHLGCYGRTQASTPIIDALAAEGFLFETNISSNPVTQAAHSTIMTGVYPMAHGVRDNTLFRLPEGRQTLAELLGAAGYATGAAIGGFPLTREFGTAQGFEHYDDDLRANRLDHWGRPAQRPFASWYDERPAAHVNDAILPWLRQPRERPFFVWLHYWDPHHPHIAPPPYGQLFAHSPYDGEIAYTDACLGAILAELRSSGEYQRTLIVVTADHGEGLYEHDEATHAYLAYDTTIHVPLIVRVPNEIGGDRISERTGTVDIVPTILDLVGIEAPSELHGRSLKGLMLGTGQNEPNRLYYAESLSPRLSHGHGELRVLMRGPRKYIYGPRAELFDPSADPGEAHELSHAEPETSRDMEAALRDFIRSHATSSASEAAHDVDRTTRLALEALGYLSSGTNDDPSVEEILRRDGLAPQDHVNQINLEFRLRRAVDANEWSLALTVAEKLLESTPQSPHVRGSMAVALANLGRLDEAVDVIEQTRTHSDANQERFLIVARRLFEAGEERRATAVARATATAYETATAWLVLAKMLRDMGDTAGFDTCLATARLLNEDHYGVRLESARSQMERGELDAATLQLRRLLEAHPLDPQAQLEAVRLTARKGGHDEALARLQRLLLQAPTYCDALVERVSLAVETKDLTDAAEAMKELQENCQNEEAVSQGAEMLENAG